MSDAYDLQDYPETPLSDAFASYVCGLVDHCKGHDDEGVHMSVRVISGAVVLALALFTPASYAQGGKTVYVGQFRDLKAQLNNLAAKADDVADHGTAAQRLAFQEDNLALVKLIHKLGEDAAASSLRGRRQGRAPDKTLLLVAAAAEALSLESTALDSFMDTADRTFKAVVRDADNIASNLEKGM